MPKIQALPEFPWFAQLLGQGPTYVLYVGWALAQDHYKYHGNSGRAKIQDSLGFISTECFWH